MGKIHFDIKWGGENISNFDHSIKEIAKLQYFQGKYKMSTIEQLDFPEKDCNIIIDIKDLDKKIDWDSLKLPNEEVKQIILSLEYYQSISDKLSDILEQIKSIAHDDKHDMKKIEEDAIDIISSVKLSNHCIFNNITNDIDISVKYISHTLGKEVESLITNSKPRNSQRNKMESLNDAKQQLISDIERFKFQLDSI